MKLKLSLVFVSFLMLNSAYGKKKEKIVGVQPLVVAVSEIDIAPTGWSVKKSLLGEEIYNEMGEKIGQIEDLIVSPETSVSFAVVSVSRFLGFSTHDVAVPVKLLSINDKNEFVLEGANKDSLRQLPNFQYK